MESPGRLVGRVECRDCGARTVLLERDTLHVSSVVAEFRSLHAGHAVLLDLTPGDRPAPLRGDSGNAGSVQIRVDARGQQLVIAVHGELDVRTSALLGEALDAAMATGPNVTELVLDLAGVPFLDSWGIRALVRAVSSMDGRGSTVVCNVHPRVHRVLDLVGFTGMARTVAAPAPTLTSADTTQPHAPPDQAPDTSFGSRSPESGPTGHRA